jgi:hypothetical protein
MVTSIVILTITAIAAAHILRIYSLLDQANKTIKELRSEISSSQVKFTNDHTYLANLGHVVNDIQLFLIEYINVENYRTLGGKYINPFGGPNAEA